MPDPNREFPAPAAPSANPDGTSSADATAAIAERMRQLPAVSRVLAADPVVELAHEHGEGMTKLQVRRLLDEWRSEVRAGARVHVPGVDAIAEVLRERLARFRPAGRAAINATGILLHTGLGRAALAADAAAALAELDRYAIVQLSLETGGRSRRDEKINEMLCELTGAEATAIVNNNAAATMLALNTVAAGKEAIVSRGQLVEIGGSFRMPDVMASSGCTLREVGTTNRTHPNDYEAAIGPNTGALCHVHTSNYRIRGFTGTVDIAELVAIGRRHGVPVIDDVGSGALVPLSRYGIASEPLIADSLRAGADLVCCSGDKLIGGPQAGLILGRREWIERLRKNPYARMFRVDKLTYAAMEATLAHYLNGTFEQAIPFYRQLATPLDTLRARAERLAARLRGVSAVQADIADDIAYVGSGSIPDEGVPSVVVRLRPAAPAVRADRLALALRQSVPSVFGRVAADALMFDMRSLLDDGEVESLADAVLAALPRE